MPKDKIENFQRLGGGPVVEAINRFYNDLLSEITFIMILRK